MESKKEMRLQPSKVTYELNDKPPLIQLLPLSLQHVLLFLASTIAVPLIIGSAIGVTSAEQTLLVQCGIFVAGIGTILQAFGIGPVGNRLPIILGATFTFVGPCIAISAAYGFSAFVGASIICSLLVAIFGRICIGFIKKLFPPLVMGCVIMVIGLALVGVAVDYCAGGSGAADYGSFKNYGIALLSLAVVVVLNSFGKGFFKGASVLVAMVVGFLVCIPLEMVDFSSVGEASWFALPAPLHFGISFSVPAILIVALLSIVNIVEFLGDTSNTAFIVTGEEATKEHLSRGIVCDGISSTLAALFNTIPVVSYSGNIGLIALTGVKSRFIVGTAGIFLVGLGFIPKLSALFSLIPSAVIGGATMAVFGMITTSGLTLIMNSKPTDRDKLVIGISLAIGLGFNYTPAALANYPFYISSLVNGIPGTAFTAILLNAVLPKNPKDAAPPETE